MQALFDTWWFGGLIVPAAMSILTGIYTGFLVGRIMGYQQELQRARQRTVELIDAFAEMLSQRSESRAAALVAMLYFPMSISLREQYGQEDAAKHLTRASLVVQDATIRIWKECNAAIAKGTSPSEAIDSHMNVLRRLINDAMFEINAIRPSWTVLVLGIWWHRIRRTNVRL